MSEPHRWQTEKLFSLGQIKIRQMGSFNESGGAVSMFGELGQGCGLGGGQAKAQVNGA